MGLGENSLPFWTTATPPPPNQELVALASCVTPDYLKVMGVPQRHGRFFNEHDRIGSEPVVAIDENLAQHSFGRKAAVCKRLWIPAMAASPALLAGIGGHVARGGIGADD